MSVSLFENDTHIHIGRCPWDLQNHFMYFKFRTLIYTCAIILMYAGEEPVGNGGSFTNYCSFKRLWDDPFFLASATPDGRDNLALSGQISDAVL